MLSDRCLSVLSVTLVYCGKTVGWIKMLLGMKVGLGPCHITLDGDPASSHSKREGAQQHPHFSARVLWPNSWMDQDVTWCGGRPQSRPHCVRWGPSSPSPERGRAAPRLLWPNRWMDQDVTWYEDRSRPRPHRVGWGQLPGKEHSSPSPLFGPRLLWPNPSQLQLSS